MHSSFDCTNIDSLAYPAEQEYENGDENNHDSGIINYKYVSKTEIG